MPARRQHASFEPLPPHFNVRDLVEETENFQYVDRISCDTIEEQGIEQFEKLVTLHVIVGGKPLVIDGFENKLDPWTFQPRWLRDNHGEQAENARDLTSKQSLLLTIGHYLRNMGQLTNQFFEEPENYKETNRQRVYLKDIDCPPVWQEKVREQIPGGLFYLNESTGAIGGPGAVDEAIPNATGRRKGKGIAIAGDLMSSLPPEMRAENLMCYIGHEGTYTPSHREMCASLGQNIMVEASGTVGEDGVQERPGTSIWFMTESKDRHLVAEYWLSTLGHDIEVENHFAQVVAWQQAPFKTYVVEQRVGDFILVPPLAPHQVWNRGTRTMKVAWNRTTCETLEMAFKEALPSSRMVCRDEQYKNKAIVYYTLLKYSGLLRLASTQSYRGGPEGLAIQGSKKVRQVKKDFKRLFALWKDIMLTEMFDPNKPREQCEYLPFDSNVTCAFCRCNIFNRFLTCKTCTTALGTTQEEPYDVCMDCFAMGRSCQCQSNFKWAEQWKWKDLMHRYEEWRKQIMEIDAGMSTEMPLLEERRIFPKRTLAEICQSQLKLRPWVDIKSAHPAPEQQSEEEEITVNDDGTVKKIKKKSKTWLRNSASCHVCFHRHPKWKMSECTKCNRWWCYGALWRAYDLHPTAIMEDPQWECPHCRMVCNTGACRRDPRHTPYQPKGTMLGHDTKKVADVRSVESLVDFGSSNLQWLGNLDVPGVNNPRIGRMMQEAEAAKRNEDTLDDRYALDDDPLPGEIQYSPVDDDVIDPALLGGQSSDNFHHGNNGFVDPIQQNHDLPPNEFAEQVDGSAPTASMYPPIDDLPDNFVQRPLVDAAGELTSVTNNKKRPRPSDGAEIKLVPEKRAKLDKSQPPNQDKVNKATKQYQMGAEKKLIDDARREGRYIIVYAQMRSKSRIVNLHLDSGKLFAITSQPPKNMKMRPEPAKNGTASMSAGTVLVQSDIQPKASTIARPTAPGKKIASKVYQRIEDDDDYRDHYRNSQIENPSLSKRKKKPTKVTYEEVEVSDEDMEDAVQGEVIRTGTSRRTRGELNDFEELPMNWTDGRARRPQEKRRQTLPARASQATKAPRTKPSVRASTGNMEGTEGGAHDDSGTENGNIQQKRGKGRPTTKSGQAKAGASASAVDLARRAEQLMEEQDDNLNAKRALAMGGVYGSDDGDEVDVEADVEPERTGCGKQSIMARGRKVRIVGLKQAVQSSVTISSGGQV